MIPTPREMTMGCTRLLLSLCFPAPLIAQAVGMVRGTVTAQDGTPLALAQISVIGAKMVTLTGLDGGFEVTSVSAGLSVIHIAMLGYRPTLVPVQVQPAETVQVQITLESAPVLLGGIEVKAEPAAQLSPAMRGFQERRAHAPGHFLDRQEIARMQARRFTDLLRRVPGVQVQPVPGPYEPGEAVRMSRTTGVMGARACPVLYYVNGTPFPLTGDVPINNYITPDEVEAVEVYQGMSQIPAEFASSSHNARCGVIVIWTVTSLDTTRVR